MYFILRLSNQVGNYLYKSESKLIIGYFKYLVNGRLGHHGRDAKNIESIQ